MNAQYMNREDALYCAMIVSSPRHVLVDCYKRGRDIGDLDATFIRRDEAAAYVMGLNARVGGDMYAVGMQPLPRNATRRDTNEIAFTWSVVGSVDVKIHRSKNGIQQQISKSLERLRRTYCKA